MVNGNILHNKTIIDEYIAIKKYYHYPFKKKKYFFIASFEICNEYATVICNCILQLDKKLYDNFVSKTIVMFNSEPSIVNLSTDLILLEKVE